MYVTQVTHQTREMQREELLGVKGVTLAEGEACQVAQMGTPDFTKAAPSAHPTCFVFLPKAQQ